jgi:hypothetical protein
LVRPWEGRDVVSANRRDASAFQVSEQSLADEASQVHFDASYARFAVTPRGELLNDARGDGERAVSDRQGDSPPTAPQARSLTS